MDGQLRDLAGAINSEYKAAPTSDDVMLDGKAVPISDCSFYPIPETENPGVLACIDGGNDTILDTPFCVATINRLFCSMFRGKELIQPDGPDHFRFLSMMRHTASGTTFKFFPYEDNPDMLPDRMLLAGAVADLVGQGDRHRLNSLPRALGEWMMARDVAKWLKDGFIIMDGSLAVWGGTRRQLARRVMRKAHKNGVVVCGLSKTSELRMAGGRPLLDYVNETYGRNTDRPWYVDVGKPPTNPEPGEYHTMIVKLHPLSAWVYRLDMDAVARRDIGQEGAERVLGSLVANSSDTTMPGYPYALVRADRFAKVRQDESRVFGTHLHTMLGDGPRRSVMLNAQHEYLNQVTGG